MKNINIKTTLAIYPRTSAHEFLSITRGASAELTFDISERWYTFNQLEQIIFSLKQKKKIYWYRMFEYIIPTEDEEIDTFKTYYTNVSVIEGLHCSGDLVEEPEDNPMEAGYWEVVDLDKENDQLNYIINSHFTYIVADNGFDYVSFILSPKETAEFAPTTPDSNIKFEVAVRLDTDKTDGDDLLDSTVIEAQPQIIVKDSLYGQVISKNADLTVSNSPDRLASGKLSVRD